MRRVDGYWGALLAAALLSAPALAGADDKAKAAEGVKPDNTKVNQRDRATSEPTAEQQKNNRSDLETTKLIRRAIVKDKSLSMYAHNVKIIAQNGTVTLKGPVRSEDEKKVVEQKAAEVAGAANVKNEMDIAPK
jgi:hyperosmotically inducible periplasmic protein